MPKPSLQTCERQPTWLTWPTTLGAPQEYAGQLQTTTAWSRSCLDACALAADLLDTKTSSGRC
eukprot:3608318-Lingulodinium_polyedra.AAC.1